ncbi:MAG: hypothetical protein BMS9Abin05_1984 [Rhodothermia bacterium]|nr:MAG: hypothetical protein BMS9Abin05_1984 [Rhodothermia bacterium]
MLIRVFRHACFAGLFALLFSFSRDTVAQSLKVTVEDLADVSTSVVHGKTTRVHSYWTQDKRYIMTDVTIQVDGAMKGSALSETVVTIPGGRVGSTLYEVSDMPVFVEGEEVVVFVWEYPSGTRTVTGGMKGKLTVVDDPVSSRKIVLGANELFNPAPAAKTDLSAPRTNMSLDEFSKRIKEIGER